MGLVHNDIDAVCSRCAYKFPGNLFPFDSLKTLVMDFDLKTSKCHNILGLEKKALKACSIFGSTAFHGVK